MQTKVWGAPAWLFLHCIAMNYSVERKKSYIKFFKYLGDVLPCGKCRENYKSHIRGEYKITDNIMSSRRRFSKWLFLLHNRIQLDIYEKSGKDCEKPMYSNSNKDFLRVCRFYEGFRAKSCKNMYGCVVPKDGMRKRSKIDIVPYKGNSKLNVITVK